MPFHTRITVVVVWAASLVFVGVWASAQSQVPPAARPQIPNAPSGLGAQTTQASETTFGLVTDEALTEGIGAPSRLPLKFGVFFFDYDLDGRLDILSANGHLEEEIGKIQKSQQYRQAAQLFWNCGPTRSGCFAPADASKAGADLFTPIVGRGSAYADIDGDGDLDVILTQTGGRPLLPKRRESRQSLYSPQTHWNQIEP